MNDPILTGLDLTPRLWVRCILIFWVMVATGRNGAAQTAAPSYPSQQYYVGLVALREGALPDAIDLFESAVRAGRTDVAGKWIDSIPAYAMLGECNYQAGNLALAHQNFDAAMQLMLRNKEWISAVQWQRIMPSGRVPIGIGNWASSARRSSLANIPETMSLMMGSHDVLGQIQRGGPLQTAQLVRVDVAEIFRALAWCVYRRTHVMGRLGIDDPLTEQFYATMSKVQAPPDVGARQWIDLLLALILIADNQPQQAIAYAERAVQLPNNLDHNLTPIALLTVANLLAGSGQPKATDWYIEAALSAAAFEQYEVAAEAFRVGVGPLAATGSSRMLAPSRGAALQLSRKSRLLAATAYVVSAESAIMAGQTADAKRALGDATNILSRRNVVLPRLQAYANYCGALLAYRTGNTGAGSTAMDKVMSYALGGKVSPSPHRYQLGLVQSALASGVIGPRTGDGLLTTMTKVPSMGHWNLDPVDALSATRSSQSINELRLASLLSRGKNAEALQMADKLLGDRFRNALPLSGRLLDIRWLMSADVAHLSTEAQKVRAKLPPAMKTLSGRLAETAALQKVLSGLPLKPADAKSADVLNAAWADLGASAERAELSVSEIAIRRVHVPRCFPPAIGDKSMWPQLEPGNAVITFCPAGTNLVGMLWTGGQVTTWRVDSPVRLTATIGRWMQEIGVSRRRGGAPQLVDPSEWYPIAMALRRQVLGGIDQATWQSLRRVSIVPHGVLWYLPFELLPHGDEDGQRVGDVISVSYAPTPGLALNPPAFTSTGSESGAIVNRLFTPSDLNLNTDFDRQVIEAIDGTIELPGDNAIPGSLLSSRLKRITVASVITPAKQSPFAISPMVYDQSNPGGALGSWLRYPWGAPNELLLAGFRSGAVATSGAPNGDDIFLTLCGLQAAGTRHILISRWPVGGASTASLLTEYLAESEFSLPLESLQRSILLLRNQELDPTLEPLLNDSDEDGENVTGANPLFWAGYMMVGAELRRGN